MASVDFVEGVSIDSPCIYASSRLLSLLGAFEGEIVRILRIIDNNKSGYLPILVRKIKCSDNWEAYSPYSYGGIYGELKEINEEAVRQICLFLKGRGIVSLFIRHNPYVGNAEYWPPRYRELNREVYVGKLDSSGLLLNAFIGSPKKIRASCRAAQKRGYIFRMIKGEECIDYLDTFHEVYLERMRLLRAPNRLRLSKNMMRQHWYLLGNNMCMSVVESNISSKIEAGAIWLRDLNMKYVHYHLSSASENAMKDQVMEMMMSESINHFGDIGYEYIALGGGRSLSGEDGLSRFKKKFANTRMGFFISKIICDEEAYNCLRLRNCLDMNNGIFTIGDALDEQDQEVEIERLNKWQFTL